MNSLASVSHTYDSSRYIFWGLSPRGNSKIWVALYILSMIPVVSLIPAGTKVFLGVGFWLNNQDYEMLKGTLLRAGGEALGLGVLFIPKDLELYDYRKAHN